jgi:hypothetical protein
MQCVKAHDLFVVFDDVLNQAAFTDLWTFVQGDTYVSVHQDAWTKVWRLSDGAPLKGSQIVYPAVHDAPIVAPLGALTYPSATPLDAVLEAVMQQGDFVGRPLVDWQSVGAATWLYPQGSGLSWHTDGRVHVGAFIYFAHPVWNCQWGGELLLADVAPEDRAQWHRGSTFDNTTAGATT